MATKTSQLVAIPHADTIGFPALMASKKPLYFEFFQSNQLIHKIKTIGS